MRAVTVASVPGTIEVTDVDAPQPGPDEVLIHVESASLNGFDLAVSAGFLDGLVEHRFPLILGKDYAGIVVKTGADVDDLHIGDRVFGVDSKPHLGNGSLTEYLVANPTQTLAHVPDNVSMTEAGALGLAGTAAHDIDNVLDLRDGETVLVSGATGGVGTYALQFAARRHARLIATAASGEPTALVVGVAAMAGTEVVVVDPTQNLPEQLRDLAPGGLDAVIHLAGDGPSLASMLKPGGRLASTLGLTADGIGRNDIDVHSITADPRRQTLQTLAALVAAEHLRVMVSAEYPLAGISAAIAAFVAGARGKIAITP